MEKKTIQFVNNRMAPGDDTRPVVLHSLRSIRVLRQPETSLAPTGEILYKSDITVSAGFNLSESVAALEAVERRYDEARKEILKEHARLDKAGEIMLQADKRTVQFKSKEDEETAREKLLELDGTEVSLDLWVFTFAELFRGADTATRPSDIWDHLRWMIKVA